MSRRGVAYDTGTVFPGPGYSVPTCPKPDLRTAERELQDQDQKERISQ